MEKYQEGQITIIHILKFVCLGEVGDEVLLCYYLALC